MNFRIFVKVQMFCKTRMKSGFSIFDNFPFSVLARILKLISYCTASLVTPNVYENIMKNVYSVLNSK